MPGFNVSLCPKKGVKFSACRILVFPHEWPTGLLNAAFEKKWRSRCWRQLKRQRLYTVAFMCDIDRFKAINDRFGHEFGDKVIIEIARVFGDFAQQNDVLVARHGGEEFAVLMVGVSVEQALKHANGLRQACAATQVPNGEMPVGVTISIGVTGSQHDDGSITDHAHSRPSPLHS